MGFTENGSTVTPEINELWPILGQSNNIGIDSGASLTIEDLPHPKVYEVSQGILKSTYVPPSESNLYLCQRPIQNSSGTVGYGMSFAKKRVTLKPSITKIAILNLGEHATGFSDNRWGVGDDLYLNAITKINAALAANPSFTCKGILWHQGENESGQIQTYYEGKFGSMVSGIRGGITGGANIPIFIGTMLEAFITASEVSRRPIDLAHRNAPNYITNSYVVDLIDVTDSTDNVHFSKTGLRVVGEKYANVAHII